MKKARDFVRDTENDKAINAALWAEAKKGIFILLTVSVFLEAAARFMGVR